MKFPTFVLEDWFREHYFEVDIVLCESGVQPYSLGEVRSITGITEQELDSVVLGDSQPEGGTALRTAIAERWRDGNADGILATHGSSEAMLLVMNALLSAGDHVISVSPGYQPLRSIPEAIGCNVTQWHLRPESRFRPDVDEFRELITPATKMVCLNFPNNPTGVTLTPDQYRAVLNIVAASGAYLVWDTAFQELSYAAVPLPDPGHEYERAIILGTLTKSYGIGGLRIGWCLTSKAIVSQCVDIRGYTTVNCSPLTELVATRVIRSLDRFLPSRLEQGRTNLDIVSAWVADYPDLVEWVRPQGGVSALVRIHGVHDIEEFCRRFARERSVFLLPGTCFGLPEFVRLGFGGSTALLREGLARLAAFLEEQPAAGRRSTVSAHSFAERQRRSD